MGEEEDVIYCMTCMSGGKLYIYTPIPRNNLCRNMGECITMKNTE